MTVPKLPLIVPKKALSATSMLVPKISPKLSPNLLSKGQVLTKSLHTKANLPPNKGTNENSEPNQVDKLTKLVSKGSMDLKNMNSLEEEQKDVDSTQENVNVNHANVVPVNPLNPDLNNHSSAKVSLENSRRGSRNESFQDDLASRLNRSSILSDLSVPQSTKSLSKTFSNDSQKFNNSLKSSKSLSRDSNKDENMNFEKNNEKHLTDNSDDREEVGYTPWLKIEKRINQIRSMASKDLNNKPTKYIQKPGLYNNYKTEYEDYGWKKELTNPLSYGMVQKLNQKRQFELPKDNWKFINGFLKPRRKPFTSMSEMSKYFQKVDAKDQYELIKLLLACRDLEKVIEEQHTVLDMLDHDLREARDLFPDSLNNVTTKKLFGSTPDEEPFYPSSEVPLFIKGRVFLLPKNGNESPEGNK